MWKFGIYADWDSIFVGGKPGNWVGIHIDMPWSEDVKSYGAPCRVYLHWWPGHCQTIDLPFESPNIFGDSKGWKRSGKIIRKCSVEGCPATSETEEIKTWFGIETSIRPRGEIEHKTGYSSALLCNRHAKMAEPIGEYDLPRIKIKLIESEPIKTTGKRVHKKDTSPSSGSKSLT